MLILRDLAFSVFVDAVLVVVEDVPSRAGCIPRGGVTLSQFRKLVVGGEPILG